MLPRRLAWAVALAATLTMTVSYIDRQMLAALAKTICDENELDISQTAYGWLGSAFSIAYLIATPIAGWWIDRIGARRGLLISVLVWSLVAASHALVPGYATLFLLRIALGVAESPSFPGAAQTVQRALPPQDRSRGFGVLFTGSSIGGLIAPVLASLFFAAAGWRFAFLASAIVGLLWVPVWIALTFRKDVRAQLDVAPASVPRSLTMRQLLAEPAAIRAVIAIVASAPIVAFMLLWGPKYLGEVHRVKQEQVGAYAWLPPLLFDAGAILFGDLASRLRNQVRTLYAIGIVIGSSLALVPASGDTAWSATIVIGIAMFGGGALYTIITADLLARVPSDCVSLASGLLAAAQSLTYIIMNPLIGVTVDHYGHYDGVLVFVGLWTIPGSLVWLAWKPRVIASRSAP